MYCQKCGKEVPANSSYCLHCRTQVSDHPSRWMLVLAGVATAISLFIYFSEKPSTTISGIPGQELETVRKQIDEAVAELQSPSKIASLLDAAVIPSKREGVCRAAELLQPHLENTSLETSSPKLAAKAHRIMAAVYSAAFVTTWNKGDCVFKLVVGDALSKAAGELEGSLRLHPKQPEAAQAKQVILEINKGQDPTTEQLVRYQKFFRENLEARLSSW